MHEEIAERADRVKACFDEASDLLMDMSRMYLKSDDQTKRSSVDILFDLAKRTEDIRRRVDGAINGSPMSQHPDPSRVYPTAERVARPKVSGKKSKSDYPKFFRCEGSLIKIGLSRNKKTEYRHIVPMEDYRMIAERVLKIGQTSKEFSADDIIEDYNGPTYRAYIVLTFLRSVGLLSSSHRGSYSLAGETTSSSAIKEALDDLLPEESSWSVQKEERQ